jgi:tetratricopeptide (TPR) repeat protein
LIFGLALIATLFSACSRDPNVRKQKYFQSGQSYFDKGQYAEAAIQFTNAVQVDPRFAEAHYKLAQTYLKLQEWSRASVELNRTLELQPNNYEAHVDLANLLSAARQFQQAQEHVDLLLSQQPNNPLSHIAAANLLAARQDFNAAIPELQKAIALAPNNADPYFGLALLQMQTQQFDAAETNFHKAIQLNPTAMPMQLALAGYYQARGRFPEAEQQLRHAIELEPRNPDPRAALARLFVAENKPAEAEALLQQAKRDLSDNPIGYRMLGDFYFAIGDFDKATNEYTQLFHDHPKDPQVRKNYVQLLILKNRLAEAGKLNDEILKADPNDTEGLIYKAQIQLREGHADDAVVTLQAALKNDPENGVAHYQLGVAFDQLGDLARAEAEWQDATRLRPDLADAHRALAAAALRQGDWNGLQQSATRLINLQPTSPEGYALRAIAAMNRKQFAQAEADVRQAMNVAPQNPVGYIQMGNLRLLQKQYREAESFYRLGLDHDPGSADALAGLMNTYTAQKQLDKALAAIKAQIAKVPNNSGFYDLLGTFLHDSKKDLNGAQAAFEKSLELDPNNSDALLKLGRVQVDKGFTDQAIATYLRSIQRNPRDATFYILTGQLYESKQDWQNARQMYQKALDIIPNNPVASNNLAYVILQTGGNLDVALSLAQTARRGMPDSPNAADTLGWVYYQKGAYKSAIDLFQEALKLGEKDKSPDNPTVHYHLGLAYEKNNQPALARRQLERVLQLDPNYSSAAEVKKALAQLRS